MQCIPITGETTVPVNNYQTGWNLLADHYAGYMACANHHWEGGINPLVYNLTNNWRSTVFSVAFTQVMPAWLQLKAAHDQGLVAGEVMAVGDIQVVRPSPSREVMAVWLSPSSEIHYWGGSLAL